ncbi:MAG: hypothetical protein GY861_26185 [bacterium]|nr:hypothetical protein [bacterium]
MIRNLSNLGTKQPVSNRLFKTTDQQAAIIHGNEDVDVLAWNRIWWA